MPAERIWHNLLQQGWNVEVTGEFKDGEASFTARAYRKAADNSPAERLKERTTSVVATAYSWDRAIEVLDLKLNAAGSFPPVIET